MRAKDLKRNEIFNTKGSLLFFGPRRVVPISPWILLSLRKQLGQILQNDELNNILLFSGYYSGMTIALNLMEEYEFESLTETIKAGGYPM